MYHRFTLAAYLKLTQRCKSSMHAHMWSLLSHVWLFVTPWTAAPPGSSVHGILQARTLEWLAIISSWDLPDPGSWSPAPGGRFFTTSTTWESQINYTPILKKEKEKEWRVFDCVKYFWEVTYHQKKKKSTGWSSKRSTSFGFNNIMEILKVPPYGFRCGWGGGCVNQTGEG